jgi:hypothetical protein
MKFRSAAPSVGLEKANKYLPIFVILLIATAFIQSTQAVEFTPGEFKAGMWAKFVSNFTYPQLTRSSIITVNTSEVTMFNKPYFVEEIETGELDSNENLERWEGAIKTDFPCYSITKGGADSFYVVESRDYYLFNTSAGSAEEIVASLRSWGGCKGFNCLSIFLSNCSQEKYMCWAAVNNGDPLPSNPLSNKYITGSNSMLSEIKEIKPLGSSEYTFSNGKTLKTEKFYVKAYEEWEYWLSSEVPFSIVKIIQLSRSDPSLPLFEKTLIDFGFSGAVLNRTAQYMEEKCYQYKGVSSQPVSQPLEQGGLLSFLPTENLPDNLTVISDCEGRTISEKEIVQEKQRCYQGKQNDTYYTVISEFVNETSLSNLLAKQPWPPSTENTTFNGHEAFKGADNYGYFLIWTNGKYLLGIRAQGPKGSAENNIEQLANIIESKMAPTPTPTPTTPVPTAPTTPTSTVTQTQRQPAFEAIFAVLGLLVVAYRFRKER